MMSVIYEVIVRHLFQVKQNVYDTCWTSSHMKCI